MDLRSLVDDTQSKAGRRFFLLIQFLIGVSLISFSIETLPDLSPTARFWLYVVEVVTVSLFTIEYGLRILVAENRWQYIFSFYGLIDLLAIVPFYISTGVDLRAVRAFRLVRVFRVFKILRYSRALDRLRVAFKEVREELIVFGMMTAIIVYLASVGIYYFESESQPDKFGSVFHCQWWAIVTLTTVGYGDTYPITVGGRVFTGVVLLLGVGVVAVPTGLLASALARHRENASADQVAAADDRKPE